jgi:hypothetical protein
MLADGHDRHPICITARRIENNLGSFEPKAAQNYKIFRN